MYLVDPSTDPSVDSILESYLVRTLEFCLYIYITVIDALVNMM